MNIFSKTNRAVADVAAKIMQEQPTKTGEAAKPQPIQSNLVDQVMKTKLNTSWANSKAIKEDRVHWNAHEDDMSTNLGKTAQKAVLAHTPKMPPAKKPLEHTKSSSSSSEDGTMSLKSVTAEDWAAGLNNSYAEKLPPTIGAKESATANVKKILAKKKGK
jgi:hypothetical protein